MFGKKKLAEPVKKIVKPFEEFCNTQISGGIILLAAAVTALIWANSPWSETYKTIWETKLNISYGKSGLNLSLHDWINDGLMVLFFLNVGLEIKREFLVGELSEKRKAMLPLFAAAGGMIFPAIIYFFINMGGEGSIGWGVPIATDIAFVVGVVALLGSSVPTQLRVFILALAIVDDIGAILIIAIFYSNNIKIMYLAIAGGILLILLIFNRLGIKNLILYSTAGVALWLVFLNTGVHTTIAGVLLALTIPASSRFNPSEFIISQKDMMNEFKEKDGSESSILRDERLQSTVQAMERNDKKILPPLQRMEHALNPWVSFIIMPVFALANAGVEIKKDIFQILSGPVSLGIIAGLFIGKQAGIFLFSWLSSKMNISEIPEGTSLKQIYFVGILAGIGFTMSLFISNLAFTGGSHTNTAKVAILIASLISGTAGFLMFKLTAKN